MNLLGHSMWNPLNFKKFPTWPSWILFKFVRWMHPSKNEIPENVIILLCATQKLWPPELWTLWSGYQTIKIFVILRLLLFSYFLQETPEIWTGKSFSWDSSKPMYLTQNFIRHFCGRELKLSKLLLRCFSFHFQIAISWKSKI